MQVATEGMLPIPSVAASGRGGADTVSVDEACCCSTFAECDQLAPPATPLAQAKRAASLPVVDGLKTCLDTAASAALHTSEFRL